MRTNPELRDWFGVFLLVRAAYDLVAKKEKSCDQKRSPSPDGHLYVATDLRSASLPLPLGSPPEALWVRFGSGERAGERHHADVLCYLLTPALYATLVRQVSEITLASLPLHKRTVALARWEVIEEWAVRRGWKPPHEGEEVMAQRLPEAPVPLWLLDDLEARLESRVMTEAGSQEFLARAQACRGAAQGRAGKAADGRGGLETVGAKPGAAAGHPNTGEGTR
jgi:hypothetical protein